MITGSLRKNQTAFVSFPQIVAMLLSFALLASSATAVVHTHAHCGEPAHASEVLEPGTFEPTAGHATTPCALCAAGVRDELACAPERSIDVTPQRTPSVWIGASDGTVARFEARSSPPRAPPAD
ncbi:MAG: hypothetical protein AAF430_03630 [Myxococcota bacterium]